MDKVRGLMFKVNKISYIKNESYERPEGKIERDQRFYCIFGAYDRKKQIQDTEFILELGGENINDPYYLELNLDAKFKAMEKLSKKDLREHIIKTRVYDYVVPYMRTRILEFTMLTDTYYPYDIAYENLQVKVVSKRQVLMDKFKRIFKIWR